MIDEGIAEGGLRVGIKAGGCNGLSYVFKWERAPSSDDEVFETQDGAKIFVDPKSYKYLDGTVLDCDPNMLGQDPGYAQPPREDRVRLRPVVRRLTAALHSQGRPWPSRVPARVSRDAGLCPAPGTRIAGRTACTPSPEP